MAESAWLKGLAPALALASALAMASIASADTVEVLDTGCTTGAQPSFVAGSLITTLKARLGDAMGTAVTCVLMDPSASGDALQFTDTGLAMYRKAGDTAMFTNGDRHWALTGAKLVQWDGGAIRVDAVPPRAQPGTVPIPQSPAPYCGVDLVTDVHARGDASGTLQSDTTQMGVAGKCFDEYFKACAPAIMTTDLGIGVYRDQIDAPTDDGRCRVISSFVFNLNSDLVGKEMACELDNGRSIFDAVQDRSRCSGPLYDALYGQS